MCQHILSINVDEFSILRVILHVTQGSGCVYVSVYMYCVYTYVCMCVYVCVLQRQSCDLIIKYKFAISIKNRTSVCRFLGQLLYTYVASYIILHWK